MYADTDDRIDARRDRRDRPPAGDPDRLQHRARDRADDDRQGHPRPQRAAPRGRRVDRRLRLGAGRRVQPSADLAHRSRRSSRGWRPRCKAAAKQLEFERAAALRDEIQQIRLRVLQEDASITVGRAAERAGARRTTGPRPDRRGRPGARPARRGGGRRGRTGHGGHQRRPSCRPTRSRPTTSTASRASRASTRTPSPTGCPGIRDEHDDARAGRRAGSIGRPGIGPSRRTSGAGPGRGRAAAADGGSSSPAPGSTLDGPDRDGKREVHRWVPFTSGASRALAFAPALTIGACSSGPAGGAASDPQGVVTAALAAAQSGGVTKLTDFACAAHKDDITGAFGGANAGALPRPGSSRTTSSARCRCRSPTSRRRRSARPTRRPGPRHRRHDDQRRQGQVQDASPKTMLQAQGLPADDARSTRSSARWRRRCRRARSSTRTSTSSTKAASGSSASDDP